MRKITDIISKPSEALQAMVDGLLEQDKRPDFEVNMSTFGDHNEDERMCYGCAAACAIQKLAGKNLDAESIFDLYARAGGLGISTKSLDVFETAIDIARQGGLINLFHFFNIYDVPLRLRLGGWSLQTHNWREQLPVVIGFIEKLKKEGF